MPETTPPLDVSRLVKALAPFRVANNPRALTELTITAVPLVALWLTAMLLVRAQIWAGLLLTIPAGCFLLRLFMIQHDCGHGSFFRSRKANGWLGRAIGVLTLTPYEFWRRAHAQHHAGTGNLDRRGVGDIDTLTLAEYRRLSPWGQLRYRMYRNPVTLFLLGPAFQFLLVHRLPTGPAWKSRQLWISVMGTNVAIAALVGGLIFAFGAPAFFLVHLPVILIAATIGIWLFYIQHQFEQTSWDHADGWSFQKAALEGSSYYELPPVLRWFSANIGVHHVHHLCSTIPFYRLQNVLRAAPQLREMSRLTLRQSLKTISLTLWDERSRRLISFREAARI
ncbi:fatty acid desaturase [Sphingomonas sp. AP4-R1]|uniref:fatty acid desaturase n=1 Tax=Sphingomonas sp. AP4-R1 TaxID=2735134 RepID=UPI001493D3E2|nr:fatty acid desaturase [Sphingomonas sp. AP4-R1]QJU59734.1 fatty acid desaturase [Sphingomonas sp. AP4-R1]